MNQLTKIKEESSMNLVQQLQSINVNSDTIEPLPKGPIKLVFFDFFATLVTFPQFNEDMAIGKLHQYLTKCGLQNSKTEFFRAYNDELKAFFTSRKPFEEIDNHTWILNTIQRLSPDLAISELDLNNAISIYFDAFIDQAELINGIKDVILHFNSKMDLGIISNFSHTKTIHSILSRFKIKDYFSNIIVSGQIGLRKPHPSLFDTAFSPFKKRISKNEVLFIGDDLECDILGANYNWAIERKMGQNLASSLYQNELYDQLEKLRAFFGSNWALVFEGSFEELILDPDNSSRVGQILSIPATVMQYGGTFIQVNHITTLIRMLKYFDQKCGKEPKIRLTYRSIDEDLPKFVRLLIGGVKGINRTLAKNIYSQYSNAFSFSLDLNEGSLKKIPKIGPKWQEKLKDWFL